LVGGFLAAHWGPAQNVAISEETRIALTRLGIHDFTGLAPRELFAWPALLTLKGFVSVSVGGFLVGFGTAYAGGCTSGHAISGLAGGLIATHFLLPLLL
ncbi:MAG TPA: YeeE/YedE thiosulfate transporter family protein, partial [Bryobacteraceae bacterium]|nr:YeeE/YedE thiosulfate transporter family protein [Bryobacteraceae bacterium]